MTDQAFTTQPATCATCGALEDVEYNEQAGEFRCPDCQP